MNIQEKIIKFSLSFLDDYSLPVTGVQKMKEFKEQRKKFKF